MKFLDLHIKGSDHDKDLRLLLEASRLGYDGAALIYPSTKYRELRETAEKLRNNSDLDLEVATGVMIDAGNPSEMRRAVNRFRGRVDIIHVSGGDLKINRAACENSRVDVLSAPYASRRDAGINHVLAREAARNSVAVELRLRDVIGSWLKVRARILEYFRDIIKLHRKFGFPLALTSGASTIYDLRRPRDIINFTGCFGLREEEAIAALTSTPWSILEYNRRRPMMIAEGVVLLDSDGREGSPGGSR
ncbi:MULTISPECIES: ribonuclease P protein component 3 [Methanothermobacter]|uniref:Ribonuclease P protein component 3 n=1 Tax=Methanothermobacter wolfeii TaxID=145261 RepID=A0A9E7RTE4_METWO|nr:MULTISPECIES: RNase P subunit p30 family protein [Methanothermobacter]QHN06484.1 ribonuclease P [Methanothermobacter sp. THM-1]UXH30987.1 ribonuclease P [Methanothermobacter wolfeii]